MPDLTNREEEILIAAKDSGEINIIFSEQLGKWVCAGSRNFVDEEGNDPAVAVGYLEALERLCTQGLVKYVEGNRYMLTSEGFQLARSL